MDRMAAAGYADLAVTCPRCKAGPAEPCQSTGGGNPAVVATHEVRRKRVRHWTLGQMAEWGDLVRRVRMIHCNPTGLFDQAESGAAPMPTRTTKRPTPKGVRLSETQAEQIERAAQSRGSTTASTGHFHGDAGHRQTVLSLVAKGILVETGLSADGYDRLYELTPFGWAGVQPAPTDHSAAVRRGDCGRRSTIVRDRAFVRSTRMSDGALIWNGKEIVTVIGLFDALAACDTEERAAEFMAVFREFTAHADQNVRYAIDRGDPATRERLYRLFQVGHPHTGTAV